MSRVFLLVRRLMLSCFAVSASITTLAMAPAEAALFTFSTADSQFDPGVNNQGWWSATAANDDTNDNTFTGVSNSVNTLNSFFTFDLTGFSLGANETIVGASLSLFTSGVNAAGGLFETLGFFDVDTDPIVLNNNLGTSASIFNDLGTGTFYGSVNVFPSDAQSTIEAVLNQAFVADAIAAQGSFLSIGGSLLTIDNFGIERVFSASGGIDQLLILETGPVSVPAPSALAMLGVGFVGIGTLVRRRRLRRLSNA